jgi:outer membrane cobalamin receptor
MKLRNALLSIIITGVVSFSVTSCATKGTARGSSDIETLLIENPDLTLKDYLRRMSGVMVTERGGDVRVMLRGATSVTGDNSPLFVVDGTAVGNTYGDVENAVSMRDVDFIRIMRSSEAMTTYGMRAANGAIVIYTKN